MKGSEKVNARHRFLKKYVISTEIYKDRLDNFFESNDSVSDCKVVMGINAQKIVKDAAAAEEIAAHTSNATLWPIGSICCGLAHLQIMRECLESNEPVTIFEDDAILVSNFDIKSKALLEQIGNDWDLIQWGFNWDSFLYIRFPQKNGSIIKIQAISEIEKLNLDAFKDSGQASVLFPLVTSFGMHAYSISPKGAKKILEKYPTVTDLFVNNMNLLGNGHGYWSLSLDMVLNSFYDSNNCFISFPPLSYSANDKQASAIWNPK